MEVMGLIDEAGILAPSKLFFESSTESRFGHIFCWMMASFFLHEVVEMIFDMGVVMRTLLHTLG